MWPILVTVIHNVRLKVIIVGFYYGSKKPRPLESYVENTGVYLLDITQDSVNSRPPRIQCQVTAVICDTPTRFFIRQVKIPEGCSGCGRCVCAAFIFGAECPSRLKMLLIRKILIIGRPSVSITVLVAVPSCPYPFI